MTFAATDHRPALLEVMAESQVSIEGRTHAMDPLFFVIATQNPVEFRGTYPLPEAQMDRFAMCLSLGYVDADTEVAVVTAQELAVSVLAHRVVLDPQAKFGGASAATLIGELLRDTKVPA